MRSPHNIILFAFLLLIALISTNGHTEERPHDWASILAPTNNPIGQSIGSYTSGCIDGATALPFSGSGYQVMRMSRKRYYGHPTLIQFIERLGQEAANEQLGTLLIGDLSQARGGPTPSGHRSHQTGLDVDIWFMLFQHADNQVLTKYERENWTAPSMLDTHAGGVDYRQWTLAHEKILQLAANQPEVDRIFVNPHIKRELCKHNTPSSGSWLRKIRPWWKHDDHFHVRLKCPKDNPHCKGQESLPEGDGCDAELEWWFTNEGKAPAPAKQTPAPKLPGLCSLLIKQ